MPVYFVPSQVPTAVSVISLLFFRSMRAFSPTVTRRGLHDRVEVAAVVGDVDPASFVSVTDDDLVSGVPSASVPPLTVVAPV